MTTRAYVRHGVDKRLQEGIFCTPLYLSFEGGESALIDDLRRQQKIDAARQEEQRRLYEASQAIEYATSAYLREVPNMLAKVESACRAWDLKAHITPQRKLRLTHTGDWGATHTSVQIPGTEWGPLNFAPVLSWEMGSSYPAAKGGVYIARHDYYGKYAEPVPHGQGQPLPLPDPDTRKFVIDSLMHFDGWLWSGSVDNEKFVRVILGFIQGKIVRPDFVFRRPLGA